MLRDTFARLMGLLAPWERRRFYVLLGMIAVMGLAEMLAVASIMPFLAVLANPGLIERNASFAAAYGALGIEDTDTFLILMGIGVFLMVVIGLTFATVTRYFLFRFSFMRQFTISSRLLAGYLRRPYVWFLDRNSSELAAVLLDEVGQVIANCMVPAMNMLAQGTVAVFLVALLVVVNPLAAGVAVLLFGGAYVLIYLAVKGRLARVGQDRRAATRERFRVASEAMAGIKEVKLMGLERAFFQRFEGPSRRVAVANASSRVIAEAPRNLLRAVAIGGILFFVLFMMMTGDGRLETLLPVLGLYAFAGLRLFPAFQQIYQSMTMMRFALPALEKLSRDMAENAAEAPVAPASGDPAPLRLERRLELDGIAYSYPQAGRPALEGLDLTIEARTTIGIVGGTGAGKTTAVDVILGLLEPQAGALRVDGVEVNAGNRRAWQKSLGYVPQAIFLSDDSVAGNIAFGLPPDQVDRAAVERAARIAELHDFVTSELARGYDTLIGERGIRLSGGQRQRIGIARALYHDPDMLILDEATSALDNVTERAVMDAVHNLGRSKTIVMIAHRLSTVRGCDVIYMMEHGRVIAAGSYDALLETSGKFRALAAGT